MLCLNGNCSVIGVVGSYGSTCYFLFQAEDGIRDLIVTGVQSCCFPIQAEDGIRDLIVTGVQTCALPISYAVFCLKKEEHTSELQSRSGFWMPSYAFKPKRSR